MFDAVGAGEANDVSVTGAGDPQQLPILRVQPMIGRGFVAGDDAPGAPLRVMLTHGYWQRRVGGEDDVLGRSLQIDGSLPRSSEYFRRPSGSCERRRRS